ncbi:NAD(P)H-dependent oxidoreductase [Paraferrimonas haliotis]|nr:NAD(P)H-dependent oxidoreductase [Paraferrimonas haliotis]
MKNNKVLILFAHPAQSRSEVNLPLFRASQRIKGVTCVDLYAEYPRFRIDIKREQQRLLDHDVVIFMFPLFWYSTPSILKEWQDLVLEYGFAYGSEGNALHGKTLMCAISAGGAQEAYQRGGINHYHIDELLTPIERTAALIGMNYLPPYVLFHARTAADEQRLTPHIEQWQSIVSTLQSNELDCNALKALPMFQELQNIAKGVTQ